MQGLKPVGDQLVVDPYLPSGLGAIAVLDIPGHYGRVDAFARGGIQLGRPQELDSQQVEGPSRR